MWARTLRHGGGCIEFVGGQERFLDMCFMFKLLNNIIISPHLLQRINFAANPRNFRHNDVLASGRFNTRHSQNMPLNRLISYVNANEDLDFWGVSLNTFRARLGRSILWVQCVKVYFSCLKSICIISCCIHFWMFLRVLKCLYYFIFLLYICIFYFLDLWM